MDLLNTELNVEANGLEMVVEGEVAGDGDLNESFLNLLKNDGAGEAVAGAGS